MQLYCCRFTYAGVDSSTYDLRFVSIDTSRVMDINGSVASENIFNKRGMRNMFIGYDYANYPYSFEAEVSRESGEPISLEQKREIENWLFEQPNNAKLYINDEDDPEFLMHEIDEGITYRSYFYCRFLNPQIIEGNGGIVGYRFTIECDSGMLWQDARTLTATTSPFVVNVDSDGPLYVYPQTVIKVGSNGGAVTIINQADDNARLTSFVELTPNATVTMRSDMNYISGNNLAKFANKNFIRLKRGMNNFTFQGDVTQITLTWQNRRRF